MQRERPEFVAGFGNLHRSPAVLLADDHAIVREGLKRLLPAVLGGSTSFLEAADGVGFMRALDANPQICMAIVDLRMPYMDDGAKLFEAARLRPDVSVLVLSALSAPDVIHRSLRIPTVYGYVVKGADIQKLVRAIEAVYHRRKTVEFVEDPDLNHPLHSLLTPRQLEIRSLLRQGMSNKLIARTLNISEGTVKNHVTDILKTLKASNRTQAARLDE
ncbi:MAG: response regulator transcription factor [Piscinibacter sp.]|nr:response regulator transcription factor [Piscinibacter sp.]